MWKGSTAMSGSANARVELCRKNLENGCREMAARKGRRYRGRRPAKYVLQLQSVARTSVRGTGVITKL